MAFSRREGDFRGKEAIVAGQIISFPREERGKREINKGKYLLIREKNDSNGNFSDFLVQKHYK